MGFLLESGEPVRVIANENSVIIAKPGINAPIAFPGYQGTWPHNKGVKFANEDVVSIQVGVETLDLEKSIDEGELLRHDIVGMVRLVLEDRVNEYIEENHGALVEVGLNHISQI